MEVKLDVIGYKKRVISQFEALTQGGVTVHLSYNRSMGEEHAREIINACKHMQRE